MLNVFSVKGHCPGIIVDMQLRELFNGFGCHAPSLGISFCEDTHWFRCYHDAVCLNRHLRHDWLNELLHFLHIGNNLVLYLVLRLCLFKENVFLLFD